MLFAVELFYLEGVADLLEEAGDVGGGSGEYGGETGVVYDVYSDASDH